MTACIRRAGSQWTMCRCAPCRADMNRKAKRRRAGLAVVDDQRPAAWARVVAWVEAGYSLAVIANLAGVGRNAAYGMVRDAKAGHNRPIHHSTAARILAAPRQAVEGGGWVPSIGTVRRLRALTVMGWSMPELAARCGIGESTLHALRDPKHATTRPRFAAAVRALYDELSMTPGPNRWAATRAVRKGWMPPLAWDDATIDDPAAQPDAGARTTTSRGRPREDVVEDVEFLLDLEPLATARQIADRLAVTDGAVQHALSRTGRSDLLAVLARNATLTTRRTAS